MNSNGTREESDRTEPISGGVLRAVLCIQLSDPAGQAPAMPEQSSSILERALRELTPKNATLITAPDTGFYVLCASADSAVEFAMELLERDLARELETDNQLALRVGIELGEIHSEQSGAEGPALAVSRDLAKLAAPGQLCISTNIHRQVRTELKYGYECLGAQLLAGAEEPEDVYLVHANAAGLGMAASARDLQEHTRAQPPNKSSVLVLPFRELTPDPAGDWFAEGITDDLIVELSRFRNLFVIARNSAFSIAQQPDPRTITARLGVRYLAHGTIRRAGNMIRVSVELADLESDQLIWAENYDRTLDHIFEIQDDIVRRIVVACAVQIETSDRQRSERAGTENIDAYSLVLQAQHHNYRYRPHNSARAGELYMQAIAADEHFARAHAGYSRTLNIDWRYGWTKEPDQALEHALDYARTAIELDSGDARGFGELGFAHLYRKEFDESIRLYEKARKLNPNDADLMSDMADALSHTGNPEKGIELLHQAMLLNPFYPDQYLWHLGGCYYVTRQYEAAIETLNKMNNPAEGRRLLAASYGQLGRMDEARAHASKLMEIHPDFSLDHWATVLPDQNEETRDHYIEGLRKAGLS